jgi:hypothetical protein
MAAREINEQPGHQRTGKYLGVMRPPVVIARRRDRGEHREASDCGPAEHGQATGPEYYWLERCVVVDHWRYIPLRIDTATLRVGSAESITPRRPGIQGKASQ